MASWAAQRARVLAPKDPRTFVVPIGTSELIPTRFERPEPTTPAIRRAKRALLGFLIAFLLSGSGCALLHASSPVPNVRDERVVAGMTLEQVEGILGAPGAPTPADGVYRFRYMDSAAWKHRSGLYFILDVWTAYGAEVFFVPTEYVLWRKAHRYAVAIFADDELVSFEARAGRQRVVHTAGEELADTESNWKGTYTKINDRFWEGWEDD